MYLMRVLDHEMNKKVPETLSCLEYTTHVTRSEDLQRASSMPIQPPRDRYTYSLD